MFEEMLNTMGELLPGRDKEALTYQIQLMEEQIRRARDAAKLGDAEWQRLGNPFIIVKNYTDWLKRKKFYGIATPSLEDFSIQSSLFSQFVKENYTVDPVTGKGL